MLEDKIIELLRDAEPKVITIVARVLEAEQAKLYQKTAKGILDDIRQIIEEEAHRP